MDHSAVAVPARRMNEELAILLDRPSGLLEYDVRNGNAGRQHNSFDCGVFSLVNIEQLVTRPRDQVGGQEVPDQRLMSLYRARLINKLYNQFYANRRVQ